MSRSIYDLTGPEIGAALDANPTVVLPFGSVEQHGPHLPNGTDSMAAELVASAVAQRLGAIFVPFAPYGITPIHAGHPGTISLSRDTFEALLRDIGSELITMGARRLVFVNWHEGNNASLDAVATELQAAHDVVVITAHACYVAQRIYAGRGGELTHGGGIETLAVLAHDPGLVRIERAGAAPRPEGADALDAMRRSVEVHGYITDVTEIADEGWYGDPSWADEDLARGFAEEVADAVCARVREIFAMREEDR